MLAEPHSAPKKELAPSAWAVGGLILLGLVGALVTYKVSASLTTIGGVQESHTLGPRAEWVPIAGQPPALRPFVRALNYMAIVWPALAFGILIGAAVRAVVSSAWLARLFGESSVRSQLVGGLAGAPLMLCSCCVAPVFAAVHERTGRAGPAGALMLAAPSLNPAALTLTFMLFAPDVALVRVGMAVVLVFGISALYTGVAGALHAIIFEFVAPDSFRFELSIAILVGAVVGGIASLPGAVIGGVFVQVIEKYADALTKQISAAVHLPIDLEPWTIYGIALIVLMYTMPMGIAGGAYLLWRRLKGS